MNRVQLAQEDKALREEETKLRRRVEEIGIRRGVIAETLAVRAELKVELLAIAARVISVVGRIPDPLYMGERGKVLRDAKDALLEPGCGRLAREYFGTKNYDRWSDQREDHSYGRGPSHGSIVFSVGLSREARRRVNSGGPIELTPEEQAAAIYALDCVAQGALDGRQLELIRAESAKAAS
jgi:hypothetical protein